MSEAPLIPHPVLETVDNFTGYPQFTFDKLGQAKQFYDVAILKGTFDIQGDTLVPAAVQTKPVLADEYWDDENPEISSLKAAGDVLVYKPSTDVFVTGTAKTFEGKPEKEWNGMLRVVRGKNDALIEKTLRFTGPRQWRYGFLSGWTLGAPERATEIDLRYEHAYGGWWIDPQEKDPYLARQVYEQNPSGSGHFGKSHDTGLDYPGPRIALPAKTIDAGNRHYVPAGFGPIARFWQPRLKLAGTYDDAWLQRTRASPVPYYPDDLDLRFFQYAPADQVTPTHLRGDEWLEMAGLFDDVRAISVQLPRVQIDAELTRANGEQLNEPMKLDTVHIDLDTRRVYLTWRLTLPQSSGVVHAALHQTPLRKTAS